MIQDYVKCNGKRDTGQTNSSTWNSGWESGFIPPSMYEEPCVHLLKAVSPYIHSLTQSCQSAGILGTVQFVTLVRIWLIRSKTYVPSADDCRYWFHVSIPGEFESSTQSDINCTEMSKKNALLLYPFQYLDSCKRLLVTSHVAWMVVKDHLL